MSEGRMLASFAHDAELAAACRARADEISVSYAEIDRIAGLSPGATSKCLAVPPEQGFGPITRYAIPWALQMKFVLVDDPDASRQAKRRVDHAVRRGHAHHRVAKALAMVAQWGSQGGKKRFNLMTPAELRAHQSKAGRAAARKRWRQARLATKNKPSLLRAAQI